jgi:hypothetical protein
MRRRLNAKTIRRLTVIAALCVPLGLTAEIMWSSGPADGFTGAPGENTCQICHQNGPDDGSLQLLGLPAEYLPGQTHALTVSIEDPGQQRWGFELTAIDDDGNGAGTFTITDPVNTQLSDNNPSTARDYVKQTSIGTHNGTMDGPVTWMFEWTAPGSNIGDVHFYVAGDAADGDGAAIGDNTYTTSATVAANECGNPSGPGAVGIGNANGSTEQPTIDIDDVVYLISYIFSGGPAPTPYPSASGDANCSCEAPAVDIDDVVYLIAYIFSGGSAPCTCEEWIAACGTLQ